MEAAKLYDPQIRAHIGAYTFERGIEIEISSAKASHSDWAKIRFTEQFQPKLHFARMEPASVELGYGGVLEKVFSGHVSRPYNEGAQTNEVSLKDDMLLLESVTINDTFLNTTPQELISHFLTRAGVSAMKLDARNYPRRTMLPIRSQNAAQAIGTVNAAWGLKVPFFFSSGVFYWNEKPEQETIYTFEYGVNILRLDRTGGRWELETVSAPFVKHSHKINVVHPQISGEYEVLKAVFMTNDSGFLRTYIYF